MTSRTKMKNGKRRYATKVKNESLARPAIKSVKIKSLISNAIKVVSVCVVLVGVYVGVNSLTEYMQKQKIEVVQIEGRLYFVSEEEVRRILRPFMSSSMFSIDLVDIQGTISHHPWVKGVTVSREWPSTLNIYVEEQQAIARWNDNALVNQLGQIFLPELAVEQFELPLLIGPEGEELRVMEQYQKFSQLLYPFDLRMNTLSLSDRDSWELELDNGVQVKLGSSQVMQKMRRLTGFLDDGFMTQLDQVVAIDLRYRSGLAIQRKEAGVERLASTL